MFVAFKITGFIAWSWWFVFVPLYVGLGILILAAIFKSTIKKEL